MTSMRRALAWSTAAVALATGAALTLREPCPRPPAPPGGVQRLARGQGLLRVGAAQEPLSLRLPMELGGPPPPRATASRQDTPLLARALVLDVGGARVGWLHLDALLVTASLTKALQEGVGFPVLLTATHTHAGPCCYDTRLVVQVGGLGRFRPEVEEALVRAGRVALERAEASLTPAHLRLASTLLPPGLVVPRSGPEADQRLLVAALESPAGARLAELLLLAGHPTLTLRGDALDGDFPARLAAGDGGAVSLVLQGLGGNASVSGGDPDEVAGALRARVEVALAGPGAQGALAGLSLRLERVTLPVPAPDARRLAPWPASRWLEAALCDDLDETLALHRLSLGPLALLFVPLEVTALAGPVLEEAAEARVVSLAGGYLGYLEAPQVVREGRGESSRQYLPAELLDGLAGAARTLSRAGHGEGGADGAGVVDRPGPARQQ